MSRTTTLLERGRSQLSCVPEHGTDVGAAASTDWTRTPGTVLGGGRRVDRNSNLSRTGAAIIARRNGFREEPWKSAVGAGVDANGAKRDMGTGTVLGLIIEII